MEVPQHAEGDDADRSHMPRAVPVDQPLRREHRDGRRRRNPALLEHVPLTEQGHAEQAAIEDHALQHGHPMKRE